MANGGFPYFFEKKGLVKLSAISPRAIVGWELVPQRNARLKSFPIVLTVEDPAKVHSAA